MKDMAQKMTFGYVKQTWWMLLSYLPSGRLLWKVFIEVLLLVVEQHDTDCGLLNKYLFIRVIQSSHLLATYLVTYFTTYLIRKIMRDKESNKWDNSSESKL